MKIYMTIGVVVLLSAGFAVYEALHASYLTAALGAAWAATYVVVGFAAPSWGAVGVLKFVGYVLTAVAGCVSRVGEALQAAAEEIDPGADDAAAPLAEAGQRQRGFASVGTRSVEILACNLRLPQPELHREANLLLDQFLKLSPASPVVEASSPPTVGLPVSFAEMGSTPNVRLAS